MKILSITVKDLKILFRDRGTLITLFLSPLMFIIVMSLALGQSFSSLGNSAPSSFKVLLVNDDPLGTLATRFVGGLRATSSASQVQFETHDAQGLPLDDHRAVQMIKDGTRSVAVLIPAGFSRQVAGGGRGTVSFVVDPGAAQQVVRPVQALVQAILTQSILAVAASHAVLSTTPAPGMVAQVGRQDSTRGTDARRGPAGGATLQVTTPAGTVAPKYPTVYQQNVPGYTIMYVFFIVGMMAASIMQERRDGTFRRLLSAPVSKPVLLLGKLVPYYIATLVQVVILFGVGTLVFGMNLGAHPLGLIVITVALSACAVSLGLLVATVAKTEGGVSGLASIIVLVLAALGGCMVPPVFMPEFMTKLALLTPHGWALLGYQDVMVRGADVPSILSTFGALMGFAALFFLTAVGRFRFE